MKPLKNVIKGDKSQNRMIFQDKQECSPNVGTQSLDNLKGGKTEIISWLQVTGTEMDSNFY